MNRKQRVIDNPGEWVLTLQGDFIRIKDELKSVDKQLEVIRQKLSSSGRFKGKSAEQIIKERYDKVLNEVNFDYEKFHDWLYQEENQDKIEKIKLEGQDFREAVLAIFSYIESFKEKWREKVFKGSKNLLVNEETGQVIYDYSFPDESLTFHCWRMRFRWINEKILIPLPRRIWPTKEKHTATLIFLHGTGGAGSLDDEIAEKFPNLKIIYPYSLTLKYDMWHGLNPAPGGSQTKGWINVTGDVHEIMEADVCPNNPTRENYDDVDKSIHLDYPQLMRAAAYVNEIVEEEIAAGIPPEKIVISGYSQGGLVTLATALNSRYRLGGFISLCGILPCSDKLLKITEDKNKETPILIINNSKDSWVPFWAGKKTNEILSSRGYNTIFKTTPQLGHSWKNKDVVEFLEKCFNQRTKNDQTTQQPSWELAIIGGIIGGIVTIILIGIKLKKTKTRSIKNT